jgi:hypothetical protein
MSHRAQEKKLRDVEKTTKIVISRKTFQEENEELSARNFPANKCCRRDSNPQNLCSTLVCANHCATEAIDGKNFQKPSSDIRNQNLHKVGTKEKHEILVNAK